MGIASRVRFGLGAVLGTYSNANEEELFWRSQGQRQQCWGRQCQGCCQWGWLVGHRIRLPRI